MPGLQPLDVLSQQLHDPDAEQRQRALDRVSDLSPRGAPELIAPLLHDEDEDVRVQTMVCLRDLRHPAAVPLLIQALGAEATDRAREYAVMALSGFTAPEIRDSLLAALAHPADLSGKARMMIARQLWRYPDDAVVDALMQLALDDTERNVRSHAADSLALLFLVRGQPEEWAPFWRRLAGDPEFGVSRFAEDSLRRLGQSPAGPNA